MRSNFSLKTAELSDWPRITTHEDSSAENVQTRDEKELARFGKKQQVVVRLAASCA